MNMVTPTRVKKAIQSKANKEINLSLGPINHYLTQQIPQQHHHVSVYHILLLLISQPLVLSTYVLFMYLLDDDCYNNAVLFYRFSTGIRLLIMIMVVNLHVIILIQHLLKAKKVVVFILHQAVIYFMVVMISIFHMLCILEISGKNYKCIHSYISLNCTSLTDTKKVIHGHLQQINGLFASYYMVDTSIHIIYIVNNRYIARVSFPEKWTNLRQKIISHKQWVHVDAQKIHFDYVKWVPTFIKFWLVFLLIVQWLCMFIFHVVIVQVVCENIWSIFGRFQVLFLSFLRLK